MRACTPLTPLTPFSMYRKQILLRILMNDRNTTSTDTPFMVMSLYLFFTTCSVCRRSSLRHATVSNLTPSGKHYVKLMFRLISLLFYTRNSALAIILCKNCVHHCNRYKHKHLDDQITIGTDDPVQTSFLENRCFCRSKMYRFRHLITGILVGPTNIQI